MWTYIIGILMSGSASLGTPTYVMTPATMMTARDITTVRERRIADSITCMLTDLRQP